MAAVLLLAAVSIVPYIPGFGGTYTWDDDAVADNYFVRARNGLRTIWFRPGELASYETHYWPLVYTSFWLEYRLCGLNPHASKMVNAGFHCANALLMWLLLRRMGARGAWLAAALFGAHPIHAESVSWIIERKDVLSAFFFVVSFLAFVEYHRRGLKTLLPASPRFAVWRSALYVMSLFCFVFALLSKMIAMSLPAGLVLWLWWRRGRLRARDAAALAPFFAFALVIPALDLIHYTGTQPQPISAGFGLTLIERCLLASRILWFYAWKIVWPSELLTYYYKWDPSLGNWVNWLSFVMLLAAVAVLWFGRGRFGRGTFACAAFYAVTLFPVLGFVDFNFLHVYSWVADRFVYLASAGLFVIPASGAAWAVRRRGLPARAIAGAIAAAVLALLCALTWRQAGLYGPQKGLFYHSVERNPKPPAEACSNAGTVMMDRGDLEGARQLFLRAIDIKAASPLAYSNMAVTLNWMGKNVEGLICADKALEIQPGDVRIMNIRGSILANLGRYDDAEKMFRMAGLKPYFLPPKLNLAALLVLRGKSGDARLLLESCVKEYPEYADVHTILGMLSQKEGKLEEAAQQLAQAVSLSPGQPQVHGRLGNILDGFLNRRREAVGHLRQALKTNPDSPPALNDLAWILATCPEKELRNPTEAVSLAEKACQRTGMTNYQCFDTLAAAYAAAGRFDEAKGSAARAIELGLFQGQVADLDEMKQRLELYKQDQAYIETSASLAMKNPSGKSTP